ncbi:UNVERIFIED_CONTAM: hypothetical protein Sradi_1300100 [Sesamum radiatum]|uniref:Uncharacterized protein n=1 Tax=Sesamum radiatum TaxID=300843 RepID=A0AAW2UNQ9_SESRA
MTAAPRSTDLGADIHKIIVSPNALPVELSSDLLGTISTDDRFGHSRATSSPRPYTSDNSLRSDRPEQADPVLAIPRTNTTEGPSTQLPTQMGDILPPMADPIGVSPKGAVGCSIPGDESIGQRADWHPFY